MDLEKAVLSNVSSSKGLTNKEWRQLQTLAARVNALQKEFDELKAKVYARHNSECCLDRRMKENG
jgi:hypothetical protein